MELHFCRSCGYLERNNDDRINCPACNATLENLEIDLYKWAYMTKQEKEEYRLSLQPYEKYDPDLWKQRIKYDENSIAEIRRMVANSQTSQKPTVKCPYCNSVNTKKISTFSKGANTALFGLFGTKRHHQWHCNSCDSDF